MIGGPEACVLNLGPRQTRLRRVGAATFLGAGVALGAAALVLRAGLPLRAAAVASFFVGALSLLQARAKT